MSFGKQVLRMATAQTASPETPQPEPSEEKYIGWSIGLKTKRPDQVIQHIQQGLPARSVDRLRRLLGLSLEETVDLMGTSTRTLARRQKSGHLAPAESDRLYRVGRLYERAVEVFESYTAARQWFKQPQWGLGGSRPIDYVLTDPGAQEVEALLDRIEYGVLA